MDHKIISDMASQYAKPLITGCIGGIASAFLVGGVHVVAGMDGADGMFGILLKMNETYGHVIDIVTAFGCAFLLSWILYRKTEKADNLRRTVLDTVQEKIRREKRIDGQDGQEGKTDQISGVVYSPLEGQVVPLEDVPDDTFAAKVLGDGAAVVPSVGEVYAPFDGRVERLYKTKHAIAVHSMDGIELLIHIGINTEELDGKFYESCVSDDEEIQKGELLLRFDMSGMKEAGYSTVTPVIVTNSDDYDVVHLSGKDMVDNRDILIWI